MVLVLALVLRVTLAILIAVAVQNVLLILIVLVINRVLIKNVLILAQEFAVLMLNVVWAIMYQPAIVYLVTPVILSVLVALYQNPNLHQVCFCSLVFLLRFSANRFTNVSLYSIPSSQRC